MWPEWLIEGLEPAEIEALMAAVSSQEVKVEPVDWGRLPEWLTEGLEETSWEVRGDEEAGQDLSEVEPACLRAGRKQRERVLTFGASLQRS